jgi:hypothetical protein
MRNVENLWEISTTPRQTVDHASCQALHRRGFDPGPVATRVDLAKSNVLTNKQVIAQVILEDDADFAAQILPRVFAQARFRPAESAPSVAS